jgi:folate-binding protein YgfZ
LLAPLQKELIVATGADRSRFVHGVVTANVAGTPVGGGCHALLLTVKAHIVAEMRIFVREEELVLVVEAGQGAVTAEALSRYAIMDDFAAAVRPDWASLAVLGPAAGRRLLEGGVATAPLAARPLWSHAAVGDWWVARVKQLGVDGYWIGGAPDAVARLRTALERSGVPVLAPDLVEAARIVAREPGWGREITADYFPMEVGLDDAIDYAKGCFLGQEPIVRIRDRGHTNWRLAGLDLGPAAASVAPGDRLETDAKPKAGKVTSVGRLPNGQVVALGLVHVSVAAGAEIRVVGAAATAPARVIA